MANPSSEEGYALSRNPKAPGGDAMPFVQASWRKLQTRFGRETQLLPVVPAASVAPIPAELVAEIASSLLARDVLSMCLTCSQWHSLLVPALYATVTIKSFPRCKTTLPFLYRNQQYCQWIRTLVVSLQIPDWPPPFTESDRRSAVTGIRAIEASRSALITLSKCLENLRYFVWEGVQLPSDEVWNAFRANCPKLEGISTNIGPRGAAISRGLYELTNLTRFSLIVSIAETANQNWLIVQSELPTVFWALIFTQCPALEQLAITSRSPFLLAYNFSPVIRGRWPRLKSLTLGPFGQYMGGSIGPSLHHDEEFVQFFEAHPRLEELDLFWALRNPLDDGPPFLPFARSPSPNALPNLQSFAGIWQQVQALPNTAQLQELCLTCEPLNEWHYSDVTRIIVQVQNLRSLAVAFTSLANRTNKNPKLLLLFKTIASSCRRLNNLDLICRNSKKNNLFTPLVMELKDLPDLRRVSLSERFARHTLLEQALYLIKSIPAVNEVALEAVDDTFPGNTQAKGLYKVLVDPQTRQRSLEVESISIANGSGVVSEVWLWKPKKYRLPIKDL